MCTRTQEKGTVTPKETESYLPVSVQESPMEAWVNIGLSRGQGHWLQQSWEAQHANLKSFEGDHHWSQAKLQGGNRALPISQKIGLKIYWVWPRPSEQDPVFPTASPSHQEASTNLLSSFIRGQTERKPQSQKLTKLITWIAALSNSMKLWAMPCRATQDGWVTVESSDKIWSTGEGNGMANYFSILGLRNQWTV